MKVLKAIGMFFAGLILLIAIAAAVLIFLGGRKAGQSYEIPDGNLVSPVPSRPASIERGEHLAKILACADCHGEKLGGTAYVDAPPFLVSGSNLTDGLGGVGQDYDMADWDRAIRYGVKPDGGAVFFMMPSALYHGLSDSDMADLAAYLDNLAPHDNELPDSKFRPLGKLIVGTGAIDPSSVVNVEERARASAPARGVTAEYGGYLSSVTCVECHGNDLQGGPHPDPDGPAGPSLADASGWDLDVFANALQFGINSDDEQMDPKWMPWTAFRHMTDEEVEALHLHLQEVFE
jgi:cytochrome c553